MSDARLRDGAEREQAEPSAEQSDALFHVQDRAARLQLEHHADHEQDRRGDDQCHQRDRAHARMGDGLIAPRTRKVGGEQQLTGSDPLDRHRACQTLVGLHAVLDDDVVSLTIEQLGDRQTAAPLGQRHDHPVRFRLFDDPRDTGERADETPVALEPRVATVIDDPDDLVSQVRSQVDLVDDAQRQLAGADDQDPLGPLARRHGLAEHDGPQWNQQHSKHEEARGDRAFVEARVWNNGVEAYEQDRCKHNRLDEPLEASKNTESPTQVIRVVVVKSDTAADRQGYGVAENSGDFDHRRPRTLRFIGLLFQMTRLCK